MMKTSCPQCETIFTLNQQQVEKRNGMVRCGVCRQVFNALDYLYEQEDDYPILQEDASTSMTCTDSVHIERSGLPQSVTEEMPSSAVPISPATYAYGRSEPSWDKEQAAHSGDYYIRQDAHVEPPPSDRDDGEEGFRVQGDSVYDEEDFLPQHRSSGFGLGWFVLSLLAILLLGAQLFYVFRYQIGSAFPSTRPFLMQMCGLLKCDVDFQKSVDNLALENVRITADKTKLPKRGERALLLQAVLMNKVDQGQEWPVLVLRLKNKEGAVMNSKNILPQEYLAPEQVMKPFPAHSRQTVYLPFILREEAVSHYELSVFYP